MDMTLRGTKTMKNRLLLLLTLLTLVLVGLAAPAFNQATVAYADELYPCDPSPTMVRICELQGGTFNYVTCQCEYP